MLLLPPFVAGDARDILLTVVRGAETCCESQGNVGKGFQFDERTLWLFQVELKMFVDSLLGGPLRIAAFGNLAKLHLYTVGSRCIDRIRNN